MPRSRPRTPKRTLAQREHAHRVARHDALRLMAETPGGVAPFAGEGRGIGLLVGLERDGFAARSARRDACGDLRFTITDAGADALAAARDGQL